MRTKTYEVDIDLIDIFEEIDDEELIKEVNRRGILEDLLPDEDYEDVEAKNPLDMPSYEFRRYICDILNLGHHVLDDAIINEIKSRIWADKSCTKSLKDSK